MKNLSKAIIIFILFTSCEKYIIGDVKVITSNSIGSSSFFNYVVFNKHMILKGKINKEFFTGDIYPLSTVQKVEMHRFPNVSKDLIKQKNIFAFSRLSGNKGSSIECFIRQNSKRAFYAGGIGRCYFKNGKSFDIQLQKKSVW